MPLTPTGELVAAAARRSASVAAFNVITLEHAEAIVHGAEAAASPVVLQVSQNAVAFHGGRLRPISAACREVAHAADVPVGLHLDHVEDDELATQAAEAGFGSLMYDASSAPYEQNVARTRAAADRAHADGLWVEAELGQVGGKHGTSLGAHEPGARTDPDEAAAFVAATGVDGLAVAVGSSHAMTERSASLDLQLIARLREAVPVPLVLHGSSGVPDPDLAAAVRAGIVKVNVGTALNVAFSGAVRGRLAADPRVADPRAYLASARDAVAEEVFRVLSVLR